MSIKFLIKTMMAFGLHYYLESRFLYAYEINGVCSIPLTIDIKKVIKNKFCKIIFPREFKNYRESLDGISRISVLGLLHCAIFYFPIQMVYFAAIVIGLFNEYAADRISMAAFNIMFLGFAIFLVSNILTALIFYIRKRCALKRKK